MARPCPCGRKLTYDTCCGRFHSGAIRPETALELMRSRYAAYVEGLVDYLVATTGGVAAAGLDPAELVTFCTGLRAAGLDILKTEAGAAADTTGVVAFRAKLRKHGQNIVIEERSRFERGPEGQWLYVDGCEV